MRVTMPRLSYPLRSLRRFCTQKDPVVRLLNEHSPPKLRDPFQPKAIHFHQNRRSTSDEIRSRLQSPSARLNTPVTAFPAMSLSLKPLYTTEQIHQRVSELASGLDRQFAANETPHLVAVLKGGFMFLADLARAMPREVTIDFVKMQSYGSETMSSGTPQLVHGPAASIRGRHVVIVEDIVDTGLTLQALRRRLLSERPASLRTVALLDKPSRRRTAVPIDLVGFRIRDEFVVGYGLDHDEAHRQLPYLGVILA